MWFSKSVKRLTHDGYDTLRTRAESDLQEVKTAYDETLDDTLNKTSTQYREEVEYTRTVVREETNLILAKVLGAIAVVALGVVGYKQLDATAGKSDR